MNLQDAARRAARKAVPVSAGLLTALFYCSLVWAQSGSMKTERMMARLISVKPEKVNEYLELRRTEVTPAYKKAGISTSTTLVTVLGNANEYLTVTPLPKMSDLERNPIMSALGEEGGGRLIQHLNELQISQRVYLFDRVLDLSMIPPTPAPYQITVRWRMAPGKASQYETWFKTDALPVYKKAVAAGKIAGFVFNRRDLGGNVNERTLTFYYSKLADMDAGEPLAAMLGAQAAATLRAKVAGISNLVEVVMRRRIPELSY